MIKFFRKIRQRLIAENKFSKYLLYAIGEIILVVIGILIALQINNLNENRKLKNLENALLIDIRDNLIATQTNLEANISYNKKTVYNYEKILEHIKEDLPYSNALDSAFSYMGFWSEPYFAYTAYETIKSKGMDIIQNDSLKILITALYEQYVPFLIDEFRGEWELHHSLVLPFIVRNIQYINDDVARPNNFNDLKANVEFKNLMGIKINTRKSDIQFAEKAREKVDSLIFMIDRELYK